MQKVEIPRDLDAVADEAWRAAEGIPGFLGEPEARFLALACACAPPSGAVVEIGSFKGKSTVILAGVARKYGTGPVVAIDPHNFNNAELKSHRTAPDATSYNEFLANLEAAGLRQSVEIHRALSGDVAQSWSRPIRLLWIDGDHSYPGTKADFAGFAKHLAPGAIVAFHDALHEFSGPIRVFVEDVLGSDRFGAAGFVQSIAWAQFRPEDGTRFRDDRQRLERMARRLIPFLRGDDPPRGLDKLRYKLNRARVPRSVMPSHEWAALLNRA